MVNNMVCYNCKHGGWTHKLHMSHRCHQWGDGFEHVLTMAKAAKRGPNVRRRFLKDINTYTWTSSFKDIYK